MEIETSNTTQKSTYGIDRNILMPYDGVVGIEWLQILNVIGRKGL